jgi:hypothetical protein
VDAGVEYRNEHCNSAAAVSSLRAPMKQSPVFYDVKPREPHWGAVAIFWIVIGWVILPLIGALLGLLDRLHSYLW